MCRLGVRNSDPRRCLAAFAPGRPIRPIGCCLSRRPAPLISKVRGPMAEVLKIGSHDELIAVVPHALGFRPVESMVCLPIGGGPIARVDLPASEDVLEPWLETLTDVYLHRHRPARIALVAFGAD